jgi:hypothetical protein
MVAWGSVFIRNGSRRRIGWLPRGSTQRLAAIGQTRAKAASRALCIIVVIFAFGLGGAELFGTELTSVALPLGLSLFVIVLGLRIWARSKSPTVRDTRISGVEMRRGIGLIT